MRDVEYIVFEGGGGKGTAYITVAKILEEKGLTAKIKGYAGSSAGAITAFALNIGATAADLEQAIFDFKQFELFTPKEY
ncbi:MAG: hypothetical protein C0412_06465, partial [Flavobacterium sp.]|nr:hypothetical protein [Flavobacterium sp.]